MEEELRRLLKDTWPYRQTELGRQLVMEFVCFLQAYKQADKGNFDASVKYLQRANSYRSGAGAV